jgi:hypothetical protein
MRDVAERPTIRFGPVRVFECNGAAQHEAPHWRAAARAALEHRKKQARRREFVKK